MSLSSVYSQNIWIVYIVVKRQLQISENVIYTDAFKISCSIFSHESSVFSGKWINLFYLAQIAQLSKVRWAPYKQSHNPHHILHPNDHLSLRGCTWMNMCCPISFCTMWECLWLLMWKYHEDSFGRHIQQICLYMLQLVWSTCNRKGEGLIYAEGAQSKNLMGTSNWRGPQGRHRTHSKDYKANLAWEHLKILQEELECEAGKRDIKATMLSCCSHDREHNEW